MRRNLNKAFTLVELLVVIAITGILAALLLSALSRAYEKTRSTWCQSNLKQIGLAVRMYLDSDGTWPIDAKRLEEYSSKIVGATYHHSPSQKNIWYCPSWKDGNGEDPVGTYNFNGFDSGDVVFFHFNNRANQNPLGIEKAGPHGRQEHEVVNPVDMIIFGEWHEASVSAPPASSMWQNFPFNRSYGHMFIFRHNQRANSLFGDGHIESANRDGLIGKDDSIRRRWNYNNQPHDENWR